MDFRCIIDAWQLQFHDFFFAFHIVAHMGITLTNVGSIINGFYNPRGKKFTDLGLRPRSVNFSPLGCKIHWWSRLHSSMIYWDLNTVMLNNFVTPWLIKHDLVLIYVCHFHHLRLSVHQILIVFGNFVIFLKYLLIL